MTDDLSTPSSWTVNEFDAFPSASTTLVTLDTPDARLYSSVAALSRSDVLRDLGDLSDIEIPNYLPTTFEREHFDDGNFMPDRPCAAYQSSPVNTSVSRIFLMIWPEMAPPPRRFTVFSVSWTMRFISPLRIKPSARRFVKVTSFSVHRNSYYVRSASRTHTFLTIYDAPHEMLDDALLLVYARTVKSFIVALESSIISLKFVMVCDIFELCSRSLFHVLSALGSFWCAFITIISQKRVVFAIRLSTFTEKTTYCKKRSA